MKKSGIFAGLLAATLSFGAMAKDPCGTELCLSDYQMAMQGGMCKQHIDDFFSIIKYRKDKFSPSKTLKARTDYLNKCESGNSSDKARILAKYGSILKP